MKQWSWVIFSVSGLVALTLSLTSAFLYWENFHKPAKTFDLEQIFTMEKASLVFARNGEKFGEFYLQNRNPVSLDQVSKNMINAVLAAEDHRFWSHWGVDLRGILRAAYENTLSGRITQGGSTVTQQLARNTFELRGRSYKRKLLEMALALRIERHISKEKILEAYLNKVYFGSGFYGISAASQGYFGVSPAHLSLAQCAALASILKSPNQLSPQKNPEQTRSSRDVVLDQMNKLGLSSSEDCEMAKQEPLSVLPAKSRKLGSYPLEMIRQRLIDLVGFEKTMKGGLEIQTSLDLNLQETMEKSSEKLLRQLEYLNRASVHETLADYEKRENPPAPPRYLQVASVVLENSTGGILSLIGGREFSHSEFNRVTQMRRPPALAFSPILLLTAFKEDIFPGSVFSDWPLDNKFVGVGGAVGILGEWGVEKEENAYEGNLTIRETFAKGKNSALARLGFSLGPERVAELATSLGLKYPARPAQNISLGAIPVTPLELARAYTVIPRGGSIPEKSYLIEKVIDDTGLLLFEHKSKEKSVLPKHTTFQVHSIMEEGMLYGPAAVARSKDLRNTHAVGKSGTSYDFQDLWFAGYDSEITSVVWIGTDVPARIFYGAFGSKIASPLWVTSMNWSLEHLSPSPTSPPLGLVKVKVCPVSGKLAIPECLEALTSSGPREEYDKVDAPSRKMCHVHSVLLRPAEREVESSPWPKATQTVDLSRIRPIGVKSSNVEGFDPYDSSFYLSQKTYVSSPALPSRGESALPPSSDLQKRPADGIISP